MKALKHAVIFIILLSFCLCVCLGCSITPEENAATRTKQKKTTATAQITQVPTKTQGIKTVPASAEDFVAVVYLSTDGVDETCAVINAQGQYTVAPGIYKTISNFIENKAIAVARDNYYHTEYRIIDKSGHVYKTMASSELGAENNGNLYGNLYCDGMLPIFNGQYYGFINNELEVAIAPQYDDFLPYSEGLAAVCKDLTWQFIDKQGNKVIDLGQYSGCSSFTNGLAYFFKSDGTSGYMNTAGQCIIPAVNSPSEGLFSYQGQFMEGLAPANLVISTGEYSNDIVFGIINKKGDMVFHFAPETGLLRTEGLDWGGRFIAGLYPLRRYEQEDNIAYGFIGSDGKMKIDFQTLWKPVGYYKGALYYRYGDEADASIGFYEGLCAAKPANSAQGLLGFINTSGQLVIPFSFYHAGSFNNGLAGVCTNANSTRWVYINQSGNTVISELPGENGKSYYITYASDFG